MEKLASAATMAAKLGLPVYAGGSINYRNAARLAQIEDFGGFVIGHSIVSKAMAVGIERAVGGMLATIRSARAI
jgi:pyridoxine 5-phosphate synthase